MTLFILLAFITVPIAEIAVFIEVGGRIGLGFTIALVFLTAVVGTALLRHQGLATLGRVQANLEAGRFPAAEVFDGLCLLVAGALLLTPGFVTDGLGLLLFLPPFRAMLRHFALVRLMQSGKVHLHTTGAPPSGGAPGGSTVIDGEFEVVPPEPSRTDGNGNDGKPPAETP